MYMYGTHRSGSFAASATPGATGAAARYTLCTDRAVSWKKIYVPKTVNGLIDWAGTSHEIGHTLGFTHSDKKCNCGDPLSLEPPKLDEDGDMVSHCRMGWSNYVK